MRRCCSEHNCFLLGRCQCLNRQHFLFFFPCCCFSFNFPISFAFFALPGCVLSAVVPVLIRLLRYQKQNSLLLLFILRDSTTYHSCCHHQHHRHYYRQPFGLNIVMPKQQKKENIARRQDNHITISDY